LIKSVLLDFNLRIACGGQQIKWIRSNGFFCQSDKYRCEVVHSLNLMFYILLPFCTSLAINGNEAIAVRPQKLITKNI
jgi:hypothetical protein